MKWNEKLHINFYSNACQQFYYIWMNTTNILTRKYKKNIYITTCSVQVSCEYHMLVLGCQQDKIKISCSVQSLSLSVPLIDIILYQIYWNSPEMMRKNKRSVFVNKQKNWWIHNVFDRFTKTDMTSNSNNHGMEITTTTHRIRMNNIYCM